MDIQKLCTMQETFDNKIITDKNIEWTVEERFFNTLVALDVELSEFANEGRWFKRWSKDQEPRVKVWEPHINPLRNAGGEFKNPLLEEFADAVHFFLSIANQKGWQDDLYLYEEAFEDLREEGFDGGMNGIYLEIKFNLAKLLQPDKEKYFLDKGMHRFSFTNAWFCFMSLGMIGFNFSVEDIEKAYLAKHEINHQRQESGY